MAHLPKLDLGLPSYDSLFSTEEERQEANSEKVMTIPIDKITDFKEHPQTMKNTIQLTLF